MRAEYVAENRQSAFGPSPHVRPGLTSHLPPSALPASGSRGLQLSPDSQPMGSPAFPEIRIRATPAKSTLQAGTAISGSEHTGLPVRTPAEHVRAAPGIFAAAERCGYNNRSPVHTSPRRSTRSTFIFPGAGRKKCSGSELDSQLWAATGACFAGKALLAQTDFAAVDSLVTGSKRAAPRARF